MITYYLENNKLNAIISLNNLHQMIDKPTRITPQSAILLDIVVTNSPDTLLKKDVIPSNFGDHDIITVTVNLSKAKRPPQIKTFRHLGVYSKDTLCDALLTATRALNVIPPTRRGRPSKHSH